MLCRVLLFAGLAELLEQDSLSIELPDGSCIQDLENQLRAEFPSLSEAVFKIAMNARYMHPEEALLQGAEFALIPPVSGG